jgi:hypothetical protein
MRISAIATDHLDFTRILRLELGLPEELDETAEVVAVAPAELDAPRLQELLHIVSETQVPAVVMPLYGTFKFDSPASIFVLIPDEGEVQLGFGWTLWSPLDPDAPLLLAGLARGGAIRVEHSGLTCVDTLPLGPEISAEPGIARACKRMTERFIAIGRMRAPALMAA